MFAGTTYDFRAEAVCNSGPTGYSPTQKFTTQGSGYCTSEGTDATKEWIDLVYLNTLLNSTPNSDGGYADYTNLSTDLIQGGTYDITLSPGMSGGVYSETWRVWIDYNQYGDFMDQGEKEVGYKSSQIGWETHTFSVPVTATTGETRMRVSMNKGSAPTPCEPFARGVVEDYTINILQAKGITEIISAGGDRNSLSIPILHIMTCLLSTLMQMRGLQLICLTCQAENLRQLFLRMEVNPGLT